MSTSLLTTSPCTPTTRSQNMLLNVKIELLTSKRLSSPYFLSIYLYLFAFNVFVILKYKWQIIREACGLILHFLRINFTCQVKLSFCGLHWISHLPHARAQANYDPTWWSLTPIHISKFKFSSIFPQGIKEPDQHLHSWN